MHVKLINVFKRSKLLYKLYYTFGNLFILFLGFFIKTEKNSILFNSYGGRSYDDSPKVIYEAMLQDERFKEYKYYWGFISPKEHDIPQSKKVKVDSLKYYITALKAEYWVTNSAIERGLNFRGKNSFYINTWHGTPLKKMGTDLTSSNKSFKASSSLNIDLFLTQSTYEKEIFSRVFNIETEKFALVGLPRNDKLLNYNKEGIKKKLGIPEKKKIILYAPTYRDYEIGYGDNFKEKVGIDFEKWRKIIGEESVILFRSHYAVTDNIAKELEGFLYDVTNYPYLNELMAVSDLLISDYSSIMFDYSILEKPIIVYTYDYELYQKERGLYFDIREELLGGSIHEDKLLSLIQEVLSGENKSALKRTLEFKNKYIEYYGEATSYVLNKIHEKK